MRALCAATLTFEAFLVLFAIAPAIVVSQTPGAVAGIGGPALAVLLVVAAGMLRRPGGVAFGFALQIPLILAGLATPLMWALGTLFAILYTVAFVAGRRMDAEKAVIDAAWRASHPEPAGPGTD